MNFFSLAAHSDLAPRRSPTWRHGWLGWSAITVYFHAAKLGPGTKLIF